MGRQLSAICCISLLSILSACSPIALDQQNTSVVETAPQYERGSGFFNDTHHRFFRGVAAANDKTDLAQASKLADELAIAEVQRLLQDYFTAGSKHYIASASRAGESVNDLSISHDILQLTRNNVPGIHIVARWTDKHSETRWSVAELDLQRLVENIAQSQDITPGFRTYLNQQHQILFDQLSGDKK